MNIILIFLIIYFNDLDFACSWMIYYIFVLCNIYYFVYFIINFNNIQMCIFKVQNFHIYYLPNKKEQIEIWLTAINIWTECKRAEKIRGR